VLPKAFKSWPKSNKSPDLVTLAVIVIGQDVYGTRAQFAYTG